MGNPRKSVIEINGRVYDLKAGLASRPAEIKASNPKNIAVKAGTVVDGFTRRPRNKTHNPAPTAAKKVQRSKTLMRTAVKKPLAAKPHAPAVVKPAAVNPSRVARATRINKSNLISRFGQVQKATIAATIAPLPVRPEPDATPEPPILVHHQPVIAAAHGHGHHSQTIERALQRATSHKQPRHRKTPLSHRAAHKLHVSPRAMKISAAAFATLMVAGFLTYRSVPNLAMKVAATRAGISAKLPDYLPAGFSLSGSIEYSPGQIQVQYKSNSDDRTFTIVQKTANQGADSNVLGAKSSTQVLEQQGKTIYIDENKRASWVQDKIHYEIDAADLSSDQLMRLTSSL